MVNIAHACVMCGTNIPKPKRGPVGKTCSSKCRMKLSRQGANRGVTGLTQPEHLETCNNLPEPAYGAAAIRILNDSEVRSNPAFDWELVRQLASDFARPVEWIERSITACREAGVEPQYFVDRYLYRKSIPMNIDVDQSFRSLWNKNA